MTSIFAQDQIDERTDKAAADHAKEPHELRDKITAIADQIKCFICGHPSVRAGDNAWDCTHCSTRLFIDRDGTWNATDKPKRSFWQRIWTYATPEQRRAAWEGER